MPRATKHYSPEIEKRAQEWEAAQAIEAKAFAWDEYRAARGDATTLEHMFDLYCELRQLGEHIPPELDEQSTWMVGIRIHLVGIILALREQEIGPTPTRDGWRELAHAADQFLPASQSQRQAIFAFFRSGDDAVEGARQ
jgi:hypothetical protein